VKFYTLSWAIIYCRSFLLPAAISC